MSKITTVSEALAAGVSLKLKSKWEGADVVHTVKGYNHKLGGVELIGDARWDHTRGRTYLWWRSEQEVLTENGL